MANGEILVTFRERLRKPLKTSILSLPFPTHLFREFEVALLMTNRQCRWPFSYSQPRDEPDGMHLWPESRPHSGLVIKQDEINWRRSLEIRRQTPYHALFMEILVSSLWLLGIFRNSSIPQLNEQQYT